MYKKYNPIRIKKIKIQLNKEVHKSKQVHKNQNINQKARFQTYHVRIQKRSI